MSVAELLNNVDQNDVKLDIFAEKVIHIIDIFQWLRYTSAVSYGICMWFISRRWIKVGAGEK